MIEPAKAALRRVRRAERPAQAVCLLCLADHHFLGRNYDPRFTIRLCEYHHALIHEEQREAGIPPHPPTHPVRRQIETLKIETVYDEQQAKFFSDLAEAKKRQIEDLEKYLEEESTK